MQDERERLVVRRFKFEEPRIEQIQDLEVYPFRCSGMVSCYANSFLNLTHSCIIFCQQNDLMKYFREDLHRRLLSMDFKKQVDGIEMLHKVFCCYRMHGFLKFLFICNWLLFNYSLR